MFTPFYLISAGAISYSFRAFGLIQIGVNNTPIDINTIAIIAIILLINLGTIISIFLYKKLSLQRKIVQFMMLLNVILLVVISLYSNYIEKAMIPYVKENITSDLDIGIFLPIINYLFLYVANRYIKKDYDLLASTDRLR